MTTATNRAQDLGIEVRGLAHSFGQHTVLDGVDLVVPRGTVFALLGPDGAGKTTTVNILSTLLAPDAGTVRVAGHDVRTEPDRVRSAIGLTGQFAAIDDLLTGHENLLLMGRLHHLRREEVRARTKDLLERFDSPPWPGSARSPTPAACGDGSTWRWVSWDVRRWSSWTSRRRASTRAAAAPCGTSCASSLATG